MANPFNDVILQLQQDAGVLPSFTTLDVNPLDDLIGQIQPPPPTTQIVPPAPGIASERPAEVEIPQPGFGPLMAGPNPGTPLTAIAKIGKFLNLDALTSLLLSEHAPTPISPKGREFAKKFLPRLDEEFESFVKDPGVEEFTKVGIDAILLGSGTFILKPLKLVGGKLVGPAVKPITNLILRGLKAADRKLGRLGGKTIERLVEKLSPPPIHGRQFTDDLVKAMQDFNSSTQAAVEAAEANSLLDNPAVTKAVQTIFDKITGAVNAGKIKADMIPRFLKDYGLDSGGATLLMRDMIEFSAKNKQALRELGKVEKLINNAVPDVIKGEAADGLFRRLRGGSKTLLNTWRAVITSQLATAQRNNLVGVGRTPVAMFDEMMEGALLALRGKTSIRTAFTAPFETVSALWRKMTPAGRRQVQDLLDLSQFEKRRLFNAPIGDVTMTNKFINVLHVFNRFQEFFWRKGRFDARIHQEFAKLGVDATRLTREGFGFLTNSQIKGVQNAYRIAVDDALDFTFANAPTSAFGKAVMSFYDKFPPAMLLHPFARFVFSSANFIWKHNPLGVFRLLSPATQKLIAAGGTTSERVLGEAITGSLLMGAGIGFRFSDKAGERWDQIKVGGRTISTKAFNPLSFYLWTGEWIKQAVERGGDRPLAEDFIATFDARGGREVLLGMRRFTDTGFALIPAILEARNVDEMKARAAPFLSNWLASWTFPVAQIRDVLSLANPEEGIFPASREGGLFGQAIGRLAGANRFGTPAAASPTRAEPRGLEDPVDVFGVPIATPAFRQLTGFNVTTKNIAEQELDRLDIRGSAAVKTGDPKLNRLVETITGPEVERRLAKIIERPGYQKLSDLEKEKVLRKQLSKIKSSIKPSVLREEAPRIIEELTEEFKGLPIEEVERNLDRLLRAGAINKGIRARVLKSLR